MSMRLINPIHICSKSVINLTSNTCSMIMLNCKPQPKLILLGYLQLGMKHPITYGCSLRYSAGVNFFSSLFSLSFFSFRSFSITKKKRPLVLINSLSSIILSYNRSLDNKNNFLYIV